MLEIRLLNDSDVQTVETWLNKDHVKKWYEVPGLCSIDDWVAEIKERNDEYRFITHFIAELDKYPIGFCQYYRCTDVEEDWNENIPLDGTYSIDYLIGDESFIGKGFGKSMIALLVDKVFSLQDAEKIIVRPDNDNYASNQSLLSVGFHFDEKNNFYIMTK